MTKAIKNAWEVLNKVLTHINNFFLAILFNMAIPQSDRKGKEIKIPLAANIILLVVLVTILTLAIRYYSHKSIGPS